MSDLPFNVQRMADAALEAGRWTTEDPQRLRAWLDTVGAEDSMQALADAMAYLAAGMALAHVPAKHMETVAELVASAALLAVAAVEDAKGAGQ